MINEQPLILITNDDGIDAPGIRALIDAMGKIGRIVVVAPDQGRSGQAHAITVNYPLRPRLLVNKHNHLEYCTNGTPVDCVKLALKVIMSEKPDIIVSGINHGTNASINIVYSGTMAATIEGCMEGIPSVGFSLCDFSPDADFKPSIPWVTQIVLSILKDGLPKGICLNVNIPLSSNEPIKGMKITRQGDGNWAEEFDHRIDPRGRDYYWMTGKYNSNGHESNTDEWALERGYISIQPVTFDLTAHHLISLLEKQLSQ